MMKWLTCAVLAAGLMIVAGCSYDEKQPSKSPSVPSTSSPSVKDQTDDMLDHKAPDLDTNAPESDSKTVAPREPAPDTSAGEEATEPEPTPPANGEERPQ